MAKWLRSLVARSRHRAGRSQFVHELAAGHAERLFQRQGGLCAVSGLRFSMDTFPGVLVKHPFAPSLDRISSSGGYTADNVRLVCIAVNFGMGQWGKELYLTFAHAAVQRSKRTGRAAKAIVQNAAQDSTHEVADHSWAAERRERIAAAEAIASTLSGKPLRRQRSRIASLKRALTLGAAGLKVAAVTANRTRARSRLQPKSATD